eukprot:scaffold247915_cov32-Tisochrysis_lutea.AAC.3
MDSCRFDAEGGVLLPIVLTLEEAFDRGRAQSVNIGASIGAVDRERVPGAHVTENLIAHGVGVLRSGTDVVEKNYRHHEVQYDGSRKDVIQHDFHEAIVCYRRRRQATQESISIDPMGRPEKKED